MRRPPEATNVVASPFGFALAAMRDEEATMPQFETDLSTENAKRFDQLVDRFVTKELICRPDVDLSVAAYSKAPGIERRAVYISSRDHMRAFERRWVAVAG